LRCTWRASTPARRTAGSEGISAIAITARSWPAKNECANGWRTTSRSSSANASFRGGTSPKKSNGKWGVEEGRGSGEEKPTGETERKATHGRLLLTTHQISEPKLEADTEPLRPEVGAIEERHR